VEKETNAIIISFISAKGGTGKTSIVNSLGRLLSLVGLKVLLVDSDPITSGLSFLHSEKIVPQISVEMMGLFEIERNKMPSSINIDENLWLIPASYRLENVSDTDIEFVRSALDYVRDVISHEYDVVLIDCQPGSSNVTNEVALHSERLVILTEFDFVSTAALDRFKLHLESAKSLPKKTFILMNKILKEYMNSYTNAKEYFALFRHLPPIVFDFEVMKHYAENRMFELIEKPTDFTTTLIYMGMELIPEEKERILNWKTERKEVFIAPTRTKHEKLIERITKLEKEKLDIEIDLQLIENSINQRSLAFAAVITSSIVIVYFYLNLRFEYLITLTTLGVLSYITIRIFLLKPKYIRVESNKLQEKKNIEREIFELNKEIREISL